MLRKIAVALAVVAALLAAYVVLSRRKEAAELADRAAHRLPTFDDRAATGVRIESHGATWRFERKDRGWDLVAPVRDRADAGALDAVVAATHKAPILESIAAPDALEGYGLDPPAAVIAVEGVAAPPVSVGHVTPTGDGVFARLGDAKEILVLGGADAPKLAALEPGALRSGALVDLPQAGVAAIEIESAAGSVTLTRSGTSWWIEKPARLPAATNQVDRLLKAIYAAKVEEFHDEADPADPRFGLAASDTRITLHAEGGVRRIALGGVPGAGRRFVASEGRPGVLVAAPFGEAELPTRPDALRETRLTNVNRYDVAHIEYAAGTQRFAASRVDDATWKRPDGTTLPAAGVLRLLVGILEAPTSAWAAGAPTGTPTATLDYATADGAKGRVTIFGDQAVWDGLPGTRFTLARPLPGPPGS